MSNFSPEDFRNMKSSLFSERDDLEQILEFALETNSDHSFQTTVVMMTINTLLESLARIAEEEE